MTGHEHQGAPIDWAALARTRLPLVIYMGVARCEEIARGLAAGGMRGSMPVAAVRNATRPDQDALVTQLDRLPGALAAAGIRSPAILVVGEVVRLAEVVAPGRQRQTDSPRGAPIEGVVRS